MSIPQFIFNPSTGFKDAAEFPEPANEAEWRAQLQDLHDQTKNGINGLINVLEGLSGAGNIGLTTISGVTGDNVQAALENIKTQFDNLVAGQIDPASILTTGAINASTMFADDVVTGAKIADNSIDSDHYVDGSIDEEHLSSGCVTADKVDSGAITENKIGSGAVTNPKIDIEHEIADSNGNTYVDYPSGISYSRINSDNKTQTSGDDFPDYGTILTINHSDIRCFQVLTRHASPVIYTRVYYSGTFSSWVHLSNEWKEIITDQLLSTSGEIETTEHVGYSEMLLQLKAAPGDGGRVRGSVTIPLNSDGTSNGGPEIHVTDSDVSFHTRLVYPTATNINYSLTAASDTQYLSVFVR